MNELYLFEFNNQTSKDQIYVEVTFRDQMMYSVLILFFGGGGDKCLKIICHNRVCNVLARKSKKHICIVCLLTIYLVK